MLHFCLKSVKAEQRQRPIFFNRRSLKKILECIFVLLLLLGKEKLLKNVGVQFQILVPFQEVALAELISAFSDVG